VVHDSKEIAAALQVVLSSLVPEQVGDISIDRSSMPISEEPFGRLYATKVGSMYFASRASVSGIVRETVFP
jgi:hypothetical protein